MINIFLNIASLSRSMSVKSNILFYAIDDLVLITIILVWEHFNVINFSFHIYK